MASNNRQFKSKAYDYSHQKLVEMPIIKEENYFDYILDYNLLTNLESIPSTCLKLSASNNKISFINTKAMDKDNLHLIFLDLSYNRLINLEGIESLITVSSLNLSNNYISDEQLTYLASMSNLKHLNLSNNNLKGGTIAKTIGDLKCLERINLNSNCIESLAFSYSNHSLIQLDIESNKLISLSFDSNTLSSLSSLTIKSNKLTSIPSLVNLPQLAYLSIEENSLLGISIHMLLKLKCIKLSNNAMTKYIALNASCEILEVAFNHLTEFYLSNTNNHLKALSMNNNQLEHISLDENSNTNQSIEFIDLSNNFFKQICFIKSFPQLIRVNLSFNQLGNAGEVVAALKESHCLRELNLIENCFNRGLYHLDLISLIFNSITDYSKQAQGKGPNSNKLSALNEYRFYVISNLKQITFLDIIAITQLERENATGQARRNSKKLSEAQSKRYLMNPQSNKPNDSFQKPMRTYETEYQTESNPPRKVKAEIMSKLMEMLVNFQDNSGYIYYKQLVAVFNELDLLYGVAKYTTGILSDAKNTIRASLIPHKIHRKELVRILEQKQYDSMFIQIKSNIKQSKTVETTSNETSKISNRNTALTTLNNNEEEEDIKLTSHGHSKSKFNSTAHTIQKTERKKAPEAKPSSTTATIKSPFLSSAPLSRQNTASQLNSPLRNNNKCFNALFKSYTELNTPPDVSDKQFLFNFLYFINHINILLLYKEVSNSYVLSITQEEKEYKFLTTFMSNYSISRPFTLRKWYNYSYYSQIFLNWQSIDYLFENHLFFFFCPYSEIIDNFINNIFSSKDTYLMIEEHPSSLLSSFKRKEIVLLLNIQGKKASSQEEASSDLVFNEEDERFYKKNPFEWATSPGSMPNYILVPVYILTFD